MMLKFMAVAWAVMGIILYIPVIMQFIGPPGLPPMETIDKIYAFLHVFGAITLMGIADILDKLKEKEN